MIEGMEQEQEQPGGYCVELCVTADGKMSVEVGELEEGMAGTPVKGLKEAIQLIMQVVQNGGKMADPTGDEEFAGGYGGEMAARFG